MAKNELKARIAAGKANANVFLGIPNGYSAEVISQCGWNSVTVDMQHGVQDFMSMVTCFQAMQARRSPRWLGCPGMSRASSARRWMAARWASSAR